MENEHTQQTSGDTESTSREQISDPPEEPSGEETAAKREVGWQQRHGVEKPTTSPPSKNETGAEADAATGDAIV